MKFKTLALGILFLSAPTAAYAQCSGQPASGFVCGNGTASQALPGFYSQSTLLDQGFGSGQGTLLNRGVSGWAATVAPALGVNGTSGGQITLNGSGTGSATIQVNSAAGTSTCFSFPQPNGSNGQVLTTNGSGVTAWAPAGAGSVSSVGLSMPGIFTVTGSPVTNTGTLTASLNTESSNLVWAGPTTGAAANPTFRALVGADLPAPSASTLGGIQSTVGASHQWVNTISTSGVPGLTQPAFTDISGTVAASQLPTPTASTLGGIESFAAVAHQWINTISTAGVPGATQPNFTDLAGNASLAQLPSISNLSVLGNNSGGTAIPSALSASNVLDMINNVQGDVLYRNATGWVVLAPGTNGQVLTTAGAAANPTWSTVTGTGTVTNIATNNGITGGAITTTGTIGLATIATGNALAYTGAGSGVPVATTPSTLLDVIGSTTGDILYRSSGSGWTVLAPGTNGQVLTQGASTPAWGNAGTLTNVTIAATPGVAVSGTCNISTSGTCTISSASLPGAVFNFKASQATAGATITPTADAVNVCTALNGTCYTLPSYSQAFNGAGTGAGGMDTGAIPTSSWLALYAIYNPTGPTTSILGTTCAVSCPTIYAGGHMPAGYTASALLTVLPTNATPAIAISYAMGRKVVTGSVQLLSSSSTSASCTSVSLATAVPPVAVKVSGQMFESFASNSAVANFSMFVASESTCNIGFQQIGSALPITAGSATLQAPFTDLELPTAQNLWAGWANTGTTPLTKVNVLSYTIPGAE